MMFAKPDMWLGLEDVETDLSYMLMRIEFVDAAQHFALDKDQKDFLSLDPCHSEGFLLVDNTAGHAVAIYDLDLNLIHGNLDPLKQDKSWSYNIGGCRMIMSDTISTMLLLKLAASILIFLFLIFTSLGHRV